MIAWSLGTLGWRDGRLLRNLSLCAMSLAGRLNSRELSTLAWAWAALGVPCPELFDVISNAASRRLHRFRCARANGGNRTVLHGIFDF